MISRHSPATAPPVGRYSQVVRVDLGTAALLFLSGLVGVRDDGEVAGEDIAAQADQIYRNLLAVLESQGASLDHVVKITTYVRADADPSSLVGRHRFSDDELPAATSVAVASLGRPEWLIEVEAIAVAPAAA